MLTLNSLADLQVIIAAADLKGTYKLGQVAQIWDDTYGPIKAKFCKMADAAAAIYPMAPAYLAPTVTIYGGFFSVCNAYGTSGCLGLAGLVGAIMGITAGAETATWAVGDYAWVQIAGRNPYRLVTDGTVAAGYELIGTAAAGIWAGKVTTQTETGSAVLLSGGYLGGLADQADTSLYLGAGLAIITSPWGGESPTD